MYFRFAVTALLTLLLSISGLTAATAAETEVMTKKRAGEYYLTQVCRDNVAANRFHRAMCRGEDSVSAQEMRGERLRDTKEAASHTSLVAYRSARRLANPPAGWPEVARRDIARMVDSDMIVSNRYEAIGRALGAQQVFRRYDRLMETYHVGVRVSKRIRLALNLPRNGC